MKLDLSIPFNLKKAETYFEKLKKDGSKIELKKYMENRTLSQNSFLYVCLGYFAQETGFSLEESKAVLSREFGSFMVYERDGHVFRRSTSSLDTKEMTLFIDFIRRFSNEQLGLYIPDPIEYMANKFAIDKELQNVK